MIQLNYGKLKAPSPLLGILSAIFILFIIAWDVTDVKPNRLVERFGDAKIVATRIINPDYLSVDINGVPEICDWKCLWSNLKNKISGLPTQNIQLSENLGDIFRKN